MDELEIKLSVLADIERKFNEQVKSVQPWIDPKKVLGELQKAYRRNNIHYNGDDNGNGAR